MWSNNYIAYEVQVLGPYLRKQKWDSVNWGASFKCLQWPTMRKKAKIAGFYLKYDLWPEVSRPDHANPFQNDIKTQKLTCLETKFENWTTLHLN